MGTGGSRYGAGRPASYVKAEHCKSIDIRRWAREGVLAAGRAGCWVWRNSETGERTGIIGYRCLGHSLALDYAIDGRDSGQTIELTSTACTFGGRRSWFVCPVRSERVAVLYLRAGRFACRRCQRLVYASQSDDRSGRAWRAQSKLELKLDPNWKRPKGMHHATHQLIVQRIVALEELRDSLLADFVGRLLGRCPEAVEWLE